MSVIGLHKLRGASRNPDSPTRSQEKSKAHELWRKIGEFLETSDNTQQSDAHDLHYILSMASHVFSDSLIQVNSTQDKVEFHFKSLKLVPMHERLISSTSKLSLSGESTSEGEPDNDFDLALHFLRHNDLTSLLRVIRLPEFDINCATILPNSLTLLHFAASRAACDIIPALIQHGASPALLSSENEYPFFLFAKKVSKLALAPFPDHIIESTFKLLLADLSINSSMFLIILLINF